MPEEEKKTVDIDTSGPDTEVDIPVEKDEAVVDTAPKEETQLTEQETKTEEPTEEKKEDLITRDFKELILITRKNLKKMLKAEWSQRKKN